MRLDQLAVTVSQVLTTLDIPHVLLKGPTTARWLYDPPRSYSDVDLLVPGRALSAAVSALESAGIARRTAGRPGEASSHAQQMRTPAGAEVDLHFGLPMMRALHDRDRCWEVLRPHLSSIEIDGVEVPALDEVARCVVLSLHALSSLGRGQAGEDLARAWKRVDAETWASAHLLSERLGVSDLYEGGLSLIDERLIAQRSHEVRVWLSDTPHALQLQRWLHAPSRRRWQLLAREVVPSPSFMRHHDSAAGAGQFQLALAYVRRWARLLRSLPRALVTVRRGR